jgi:hypothetical protein
MDSKHTPGPWTYDEDYGFVVSLKGLLPIAQMHDRFDGDPPNQKANAHLIAAAANVQIQKMRPVVDAAAAWQTDLMGYVSIQNLCEANENYQHWQRNQDTIRLLQESLEALGYER